MNSNCWLRYWLWRIGVRLKVLTRQGASAAANFTNFLSYSTNRASRHNTLLLLLRNLGNDGFHARAVALPNIACSCVKVSLPYWCLPLHNKTRERAYLTPTLGFAKRPLITPCRMRQKNKYFSRNQLEAQQNKVFII